MQIRLKCYLISPQVPGFARVAHIYAQILGAQGGGSTCPVLATGFKRLMWQINDLELSGLNKMLYLKDTLKSKLLSIPEVSGGRNTMDNVTMETLTLRGSEYGGVGG
jgi:hypothetical protein